MQLYGDGDADLATQDTHLAAATGSLKRSIKYAGQLHLGEQFPHEQRVATLIAVQRAGPTWSHGLRRGNSPGTC